MVGGMMLLFVGGRCGGKVQVDWLLADSSSYYC